MPAYVIVDIQVHDPVKFEEYKKQAPASIAAYGGKYLARAREWYNSAQYAEAIRLRHASATSQFLLVEGLL